MMHGQKNIKLLNMCFLYKLVLMMELIIRLN